MKRKDFRKMIWYERWNNVGRGLNEVKVTGQSWLTEVKESVTIRFCVELNNKSSTISRKFQIITIIMCSNIQVKNTSKFYFYFLFAHFEHITEF